MKAIAIIQDEHRAITAVVEGLRQLVTGISAGTMAPDHTVLAALFHYIEQFPERLHHPKEDDYLFARLRVRRPDRTFATLDHSTPTLPADADGGAFVGDPIPVDIAPNGAVSFAVAYAR